MTFEEYLVSKKIDAIRFQQQEQQLFLTWKNEFEQMHPNSFTVQKLNLINPIRRKYQLIIPDKKEPEASTPAAPQAPKPGRPIIKPKIN